MHNLIFDKTDKGREEIATRIYRLAPRLRTMLLLVDGKTTTEQVLQKVAGLGVDLAGMTSLLEQAFIHPIGGATQADSAAPSEATNAVAATDVQAVGATVADGTGGTGDTAGAPAATVIFPSLPSVVVAEANPVAPAPPAPDVVMASDTPPPVVESQFASIYKFFNESIKKTIEFRGFALQLKVERASTVDDLRALRDGYIAQVKNVHGPEVAREIGERLDLLLKPPE